MRGWVCRYFDLEGRRSSIGRELRGAVATFLTMAYILFVNPDILAKAGVPRESAVACTAAAAAVCCLLMGLTANFPVALASGMGINVVVAFQIAQAAGSWQAAMGLVVLDGLVVLLLVLVGLREAMMRAIPQDLRRAIGAGIGLFIAFIGAVNCRMVIVPPSTVSGLHESPSSPLITPPPVTFGSLANADTAVAVAGLVFTAGLIAWRVRGALILGILAATGLALAVGVAQIPTSLSVPDPRQMFANAAQADVIAAVLRPELLPLLLALVLVDFFDTLGTVTAVAEQAGLQDERGNIPHLRRILLVDAVSASVGGFFGASSVTSYIESAAGVGEGARTGLHSVFVGLMFAVAVFAAPLAGVVPKAATAPALLLVGFLMAAQIARIDFTNLETAIPAFVTLATLPFTFSITHGVGYGFILFVAIKVLRLKVREVHPLMYGAAALFVAYFIWGAA